MGNVTQYLKWRGDITLLERPFNLPDNLVLAVLSYIDYTDVVPLTGEGITVKEAYEKIKKSERCSGFFLYNYQSLFSPEDDVKTQVESEIKNLKSALNESSAQG